MMLINPYRFGASAFQYYSAVFDGTNDYLTRGAQITGVANGNIALWSCWVKMDASSGDTTRYTLFGNNPFVLVYRNTSGGVELRAYDSSFGESVRVNTPSNSLVASSGWTHVIISVDKGTSGRAKIYLNGVDNTNITVFNTGHNMYLAYGSECAIGAETNAANKLNGILCEPYFTTPASWYDISVEANRLKFRTAGGIPADLGFDGSTPTGTKPLIYQHYEVPAWHGNLGSGGGFTQNGLLTDGGADKP